jgi:glycosyltransferase involved in cell wall biosynthesis
MKILHVITGLEVGGAEYMLLRLIKVARQQYEDEHVVVSLTTKGKIGEDLTSLGIEVYALNMRGVRQFFSAFMELRKLTRQLAPDLIQTWLYHSDFLAGFAARSCGFKKIIWGIHSTEVPFSSYPQTAILRIFCALFSYCIPAAIWCVAEKSAKKHKSIGFDKRKFKVIPNGFDTSYWQFREHASLDLRHRLEIPLDALLIGSVGRYNPDKDHETLFAAFAKVRQFRPDARLVLVGKGLDDSNDELVQKLKKAAVFPYVCLLGQQSDLPEIISAFDIFCLHSKTEAFPLVLGEAMALGVLCVATDVGDAAFLLDDMNQIVPPQSPDLLAEALIKSSLLPADVKAQKIATAKSRIGYMFSLDAMLNRVRSMYLDVLRKNN